MRWLPFPDCSFDIVTNMFTGFGYFTTDEEHYSLLSEWRRVLKPNGHLVLDYLNREQVISSDLTPTTKKIDELTVTQTKHLTKDQKRIEKNITYKDKNHNIVKEFKESVRMFSKKEVATMLEMSGFSTTNIFGSFNGEELSPESPRLIVFAEAI